MTSFAEHVGRVCCNFIAIDLLLMCWLEESVTGHRSLIRELENGFRDKLGSNGF